MTTIFISYRRKDDPYAARGINDALVKQFGKENIYFDLDALLAGLDWRQQIDKKVAQCDVMLVIIGDRWLEADETGRSRLENLDDLVRVEVSSALKRNIPVIPVLVGSASIPAREKIPDELESLIFRQAIEVRATSDFGHQITRLQDSIKALLAHVPSASGNQGSATDRELPKSVRVTVHIAVFEARPGIPMCFVNITNLSGKRDIEVTHVWFEGKPKSFPMPKDRPLPVRLKPSQTWETWIGVEELAPEIQKNPHEAARVRLSSGKVIGSERNAGVPEQGYVPGGPINSLDS